VSRTSELRSNASRIDLTLAGFTLAALQAGDPSGPPVLLLPGWTGSKEDFGPILQPLADAGFWVTAVDQRGQFRSPFRPDGDYSLAALGDDVRLAAAALGDRVHLLGHSFGGLVARAAVLRDPSRFRSLVLMDSGPARIDDGRQERLDLMRPVLHQYGPAAVYDAMQMLEATQPGYTPPSEDERRFMRERFLASDPRQLLGLAEAALAEPDRVDELAATKLPVFVLCGQDDDVWSAGIQADMARRLGAAYLALPGAAHSPAVEDPAATARALRDFWRTVDADAADATY
jgi:pimeloyl-ACP methyl ester carboxylesterase